MLLFVNILSVIEVLVPRHGTNPLGCRALWHGTALPGLLSAVPGPEWWHGGTTRHGTVRMPCLIVPCLIVPCRAVLVPYRARAARLENFSGVGRRMGEPPGRGSHQLPDRARSKIFPGRPIRQ